MVDFQSSNAYGHVDNDLLIVCSMFHMPLTIIVKLVYNLKKKTCYEQDVEYIIDYYSLSCLFALFTKSPLLDR